MLYENLFYALKVLKVQVVYFTDVFCSLLLISRKSSVNQKQRLKLSNKNDLIKYKKVIHSLLLEVDFLSIL